MVKEYLKEKADSLTAEKERLTAQKERLDGIREHLSLIHISDDLCVLKSGYRVVHFMLNIFRQGA